MFELRTSVILVTTTSPHPITMTASTKASIMLAYDNLSRLRLLETREPVYYMSGRDVDSYLSLNISTILVSFSL